MPLNAGTQTPAAGFGGGGELVVSAVTKETNRGSCGDAHHQCLRVLAFAFSPQGSGLTICDIKAKGLEAKTPVCV